MKKLFTICLSFGIIFLVGCQKISISDTQTDSHEITGDILNETTGDIIKSFDDCVDAGFPVMESYPRQCNDGSNIHTEVLGDVLTGDAIDDLEDDDLGGESMTGDIFSGEILSGEISSGNNEEAAIEDPDTNLTELQQKLKDMMERRKQATENEKPKDIDNKPTLDTSNEKVTEDDIENLERIIDEIDKIGK